MSEEERKYYKNEWGNIFGFDMETPKFRLIYANLKQRARLSNKYQITCLFDASDEQVKKGLLKMQAEGKKLLTEAGDKAKGFKHPPLKKNDEHTNEAFHGMHYITAGNKDLPALVDANNKPLSPDAFMNGMLCRAIVRPTFFPANGAGISWVLGALRLVKDDGTRFYSGPDPKSLFGEEDEEQASDSLEDSETEEEVVEEAAADELEEKPAKKAAVNGKATAEKKARPKKQSADDIMNVL